MSRSPKQPILYEDKLKVPEKYLRFATPGVVAVYRAERLCSSDFANTKISPQGREGGNNERNCKLVEIGAGIGGQTFAFAKVCKKVLAIESDKSSANILIQNLKKLNIQNVEVIIADAISRKAVERIKNFQPDIIFCDTERPEKAERTLEGIKPPLAKLLEFSGITPNIAIEIPPYTNTEKLKEKFEKEFISLNQQLNRLTLYFNNLKQSDVSVIALPSKEKLTNENLKQKLKKISKPEFLYSISPAIILANLIPELSSKFDSSVLELNKPVLLSDKVIKSDFLTGYKILEKCKNEQKEILQNLKKVDAGKVILRYNVNPEDYWKIRNFYEKELNGKREIFLFASAKYSSEVLGTSGLIIDNKNGEAILCEPIN